MGEQKRHMNKAKIQVLYAQLIQELGYDVSAPNLRETPDRVARFWDEFINYDPGNVSTVFQSINVDQMIVVSGIRVWSLCEHHLLPFWVDLSVGYISKDKVIGLSKIPRIAKKHARKLQIQERLIEDIALEISKITESPDVAVVGTGVHTCMVMRGVETDGTMTSSSMKGAFRAEAETRKEFFDLANSMQ